MQNVRVRALRVFGAGAAVAAAAVLGLAGQASAGVTGPAFYVDGQLYRTVGTPTDLSHTGAPDRAWDVIYSFGDVQQNVAEAAPGDAGYNGGRWQVHALAFPAGYAAAVTNGDLDGDGVLDSVLEVRAAVTAGSAVDTGVVKQFECPAIPLHN
ncbi:hypothetical protein [Micromonospora costi]|uniref:VCBS repeat-containing protein n=1 Tax=Micromonospora costi TaxID=1530042 RepID=A0A3A9ZY60_9ACTN|nr:hypothetical protein [Micromonospora costi]RKN53181.1 hypothetical protein D7193_25770 [Micromonospora costi]